MYFEFCFWMMTPRPHHVAPLAGNHSRSSAGRRNRQYRGPARIICPNQTAYFIAGVGNTALIHEIALLTQQVCPQTRIVALLDSTDPHPLPSTPLAGYCFKDEINESILHLLRAIAAGATWVSGGVAARLCAQASELSYTHPHADLTPVEQEVYVLLGRGWSNGQIVAHLHCTEQTVRNYSSRIYKKLGINRAELIVQFQSNLKKS